MKSFVLYRMYYDCPTCDGTGDLTFKICNTERDLLNFVTENVDQYEIENIFNENEELSYEVIVNKSFHRIHYVEVKDLKNNQKQWKITRPHGKWEIQEVKSEI